MTSTKNGCGGRPSGKKKTAKIEIVIEPHIKQTFMNLLHNDGKSASVEIGNWIREYIKNSGTQEYNFKKEEIK